MTYWKVRAKVSEWLLAASLPLLGLFAFAVIVNIVYIPLTEEPGLAKRFGDDKAARLPLPSYASVGRGRSALDAFVELRADDAGRRS